MLPNKHLVSKIAGLAVQQAMGLLGANVLKGTY
jgi:hypothetical protein